MVNGESYQNRHIFCGVLLGFSLYTLVQFIIRHSPLAHGSEKVYSGYKKFAGNGVCDYDFAKRCPRCR